MSTQVSNTKRIAKNTLMLYFRQILILLVSLYTVRVVLNTLGEEDYGIYNVVAGVVTMFSFINSAMTNATQRFLNYSLGEKDIDKVNGVFSSSLLIHFGISILFVILAETIGLWFVNAKLNIPLERHSAMLWVYQFTILATVFNILRVPYNAIIIAYEKMSFFAGVSIIECLLKLGTVFLLIAFDFDKLIFYSILQAIVVLIVTLCYFAYCFKTITISRFKMNKDKDLIKELISYSGWTLLGSGANVCANQGGTVVLNMFFDVIVNTAMGIASQVNSAVFTFVSNFQTAFKPQLIQSYAEKNTKYFHSLIFRCSRISFYLLLIFVVPLYVNAEFVLTIWLKEVPHYSVEFVRLTLIWSLFESFNGPLFISVYATGDIKNYQIIMSVLLFLNLPLSIIILTFWKNPLVVIYVKIMIEIVLTFWRVFYLKHKIDLQAKSYIFEVIIKCGIIALISFVLTFFSWRIFSGFIQFFFSCFMSVVFNGLLIWCFGITKEEKTIAVSFIYKKIKGNQE